MSLLHTTKMKNKVKFLKRQLIQNPTLYIKTQPLSPKGSRFGSRLKVKIITIHWIASTSSRKDDGKAKLFRR